MPNNDSASPDVWSQVHLSTRAGPFFEGHPVPPVGSPRARLFAFYLPQFHPFPENDLWWGPGFTEWRHVSSALPHFEGHIQPILPRDLGYYDLRDPRVLQTQVDLAQKAGVSGFAFYYYFPQGQRIMRTPLDLFCQHIEFPFQLIWANHDFRRNWQKGNGDVLLDYRYDDAYDLELIDDLALCMRHPCYETVQGRPLLTIYQIWDIPQAAERIARWRRLWRERHQLDPILLMSIWHDYKDPTVYGLDGAIEFPPHDYFQHLTPVNSQLNTFDPNFSGHYLAYKDLVQLSLSRLNTPFPLIKTVVPHWDNEARYPGNGRGLVGSTPALYQSWLSRVVEHAQQNPFMGSSPLVFVNGWNEWAEGATLEPSLYHGYAYANATARAVSAPTTAPSPTQPQQLWVVLGMHRSGTSLLARSTMVFGTNMGSNLLTQRHKNNLKGHWEDSDFLKLDNKILKFLGIDWHSLQNLGPAEVEKLWAAGFADQALQLLCSRVEQHGHYALKEPRITQLLPFWQTIFEKLPFPISFLVAYRHPAAVAASLQARNSFSLVHGHLLWAQYNLTILRFLQTSPQPFVLINYPHMVAEPLVQLKQIAARLQAVIDPQEELVFCREFLDPSLQSHHESAGDPTVQLPRVVEELHQAFTQLLADPTQLPSTKQWVAWRNQLDQLVLVFDEAAHNQLAQEYKTTLKAYLALQQQHDLLVNSRTWKLTRPLRQLMERARGLGRRLSKGR